MHRRTLLQAGLGAVLATPLLAQVTQGKLEAAAGVLSEAVAGRRLEAATLYVRQADIVFTRSMGNAKSADDVFLLASITKPITAAAVMVLYDQGKFELDEPVQRFIPEFTGGERNKVSIRHLLTHVCGLPDQLPQNDSLRKRHAPLSEFVSATVRTPLLFSPGSRYSYSSMGILLAAEIAKRISSTRFPQLVQRSIFEPLGMTRSALGLGKLRLEDTIRCQVDAAAPEAGGGDASATQWDWNSRYWRELGSPWGGAHASAENLARFFAEFLYAQGKVLKPATARLMIRNHNGANIAPRGLGFDVGSKVGGPRSSEEVFGHSGATGTLAWADPVSKTICVVLTTLPLRAANPHPTRQASELVAEAVG